MSGLQLDWTPRPLTWDTRPWGRPLPWLRRPKLPLWLVVSADQGDAFCICTEARFPPHAGLLLDYSPTFWFCKHHPGAQPLTSQPLHLVLRPFSELCLCNVSGGSRALSGLLGLLGEEPTGRITRRSKSWKPGLILEKSGFKWSFSSLVKMFIALPGAVGLAVKYSSFIKQ